MHDLPLKQLRRFSLTRTIVMLALTSAASSAMAFDFVWSDGVTGKFQATLTAGTLIRMEDADPALLGVLATRRVGLSTGQLSGNTGGNDLNFTKGHPVSTVVKGMFDLELKHENIGIFARIKAWHDFELADGDRAYGNPPNGFRQNVPLSDAGFAAEAKFSNVMVADAYMFGKYQINEQNALDVRVGRQLVKWGAARLMRSELDVINPSDYPSAYRPGALPEETRVPVELIYVSFSHGKDWGIDGFVQYKFRRTVYTPCGVFVTPTSYSPPGCNYVSVIPSIDDARTIATGAFPKRNADMLPSNSGQHGISLRYQLTPETELRGYLMNYHERSSRTHLTNPDLPGYGALAPVPTRLTDVNGLKYFISFPENNHLAGLSFQSRIDPTFSTYGELSYREHQSIGHNGSDLITAFLKRSADSALNLAKGTNAIPPGGSFEGYDRLPVSTANVGAGKIFAGVLSAQQISLTGEIGWSHVAMLPDPGFMRYGRADDYGTAAVNGAAPCVDTTVAKKACALDGFVSRDAWGYRLRLAAAYPGMLWGATLKPNLSFAHDVKGYAYNWSFIEGRSVVSAGLRAEWGKDYFAQAQYDAIYGGSYNNMTDRDTLSLAVGVSF